MKVEEPVAAEKAEAVVVAVVEVPVEAGAVPSPVFHNLFQEPASSTAAVSDEDLSEDEDDESPVARADGEQDGRHDA